MPPISRRNICFIFLSTTALYEVTKTYPKCSSGDSEEVLFLFEVIRNQGLPSWPLIGLNILTSFPEKKTACQVTTWFSRNVPLGDPLHSTCRGIIIANIFWHGKNYKLIYKMYISASGEIFLYEFRFEQRKITLAYIFFKN